MLILKECICNANKKKMQKTDSLLLLPICTFTNIHELEIHELNICIRLIAKKNLTRGQCDIDMFGIIKGINCIIRRWEVPIEVNRIYKIHIYA